MLLPPNIYAFATHWISHRYKGISIVLGLDGKIGQIYQMNYAQTAILSVRI